MKMDVKNEKPSTGDIGCGTSIIESTGIIIGKNMTIQGSINYW